MKVKNARGKQETSPVPSLIPFSRRRFFSWSASAGLTFYFSNFLNPAKALASVFNAGAFFKKRILPTNAGQLWAWGQNTNGELGIGNVTPKSSPVQVGALTTWLKVSGGNTHTLAIKNDGTLWAWGQNTMGQLGDGTTVWKSSPIQIGSLTTWSDVSAGYSGHSLALTQDGSIWGWGYNANGQIGDGTIVPKSSPVQIGALTTWSQISAGGLFSAALKTDDTLWAWGNASYGQTGQGNTTGTSSPVQIGVLTDWAQVSAGYEHILAIKNNNTLWAWGNNNLGQIGNNSNTASFSSPIQIGALTTWSQISAGVYNTMGLLKDGSLYSWGGNGQGQVGDGTIVSKSSPVQVGALKTWTQVASGNGASFALKSDNTLWAWGDNTGTGQLGLGNLTSKSSPTQVGTLVTWAKIGSGAHKNFIKLNG